MHQPTAPRALASCSPSTASTGLARFRRDDWGGGESCRRRPRAGATHSPRQKAELAVLVSAAAWSLGAGGSARPALAQNPGLRTSFLCSTQTPLLSPRQVPPEKCRCAVGSILSEGEKSPSSELIQLYQKFGFKVFSFPAPSHVVTATFPFTTPLSIWLAARRVHPALDAYIKVRRPGVCVSGSGYSQDLGWKPGRTWQRGGKGSTYWEGSTLGSWGADACRAGRWAEAAGTSSRCPRPCGHPRVW